MTSGVYNQEASVLMVMMICNAQLLKPAHKLPSPWVWESLEKIWETASTCCEVLSGGDARDTQQRTF